MCKCTRLIFPTPVFISHDGAVFGYIADSKVGNMIYGFFIFEQQKCVESKQSVGGRIVRPSVATGIGIEHFLFVTPVFLGGRRGAISACVEGGESFAPSVSFVWEIMFSNLQFRFRFKFFSGKFFVWNPFKLDIPFLRGEGDSLEKHPSPGGELIDSAKIRGDNWATHLVPCRASGRSAMGEEMGEKAGQSVTPIIHPLAVK